MVPFCIYTNSERDFSCSALSMAFDIVRYLDINPCNNCVVVSLVSILISFMTNNIEYNLQCLFVIYIFSAKVLAQILSILIKKNSYFKMFLYIFSVFFYSDMSFANLFFQSVAYL